VNGRGNPARLATALVALAALTSAGSALARDVVIIASNVDEFIVGAILPGTTRIQLKLGEHVRVMDTSGNGHEHEGPYVGELLGDETEVQRVDSDTATGVLDRLIGRQQVALSELGGIRGPGSETLLHPPTAWLIPTDATGIYCVRSGSNVELWRSAPAAAEEYVVEDLLGGAQATVSFAPGAHLAPWPADLAPRDGALFLVRASASVRSSTIDMREVPALSEVPNQALWLGARGCEVQARQLLTDSD